MMRRGWPNYRTPAAGQALYIALCSAAHGTEFRTRRAPSCQDRCRLRALTHLPLHRPGPACIAAAQGCSALPARVVGLGSAVASCGSSSFEAGGATTTVPVTAHRTVFGLRSGFLIPASARAACGLGAAAGAPLPRPELKAVGPHMAASPAAARGMQAAAGHEGVGSRVQAAAASPALPGRQAPAGLASVGTCAAVAPVASQAVREASQVLVWAAAGGACAWRQLALSCRMHILT